MISLRRINLLDGSNESVIKRQVVKISHHLEWQGRGLAGINGEGNDWHVKSFCPFNCHKVLHF